MRWPWTLVVQLNYIHLAIASDSAPRYDRNAQSNYRSVGMSDYIIYIFYGNTYYQIRHQRKGYWG